MLSATMKLVLLLGILLITIPESQAVKTLKNRIPKRSKLGNRMLWVCSSRRINKGPVFAVHGRAGVSFDGLPSTVNGGEVGVYPGDSITGFQGVAATVHFSSIFAQHALSDHTVLKNVDRPGDDVMGVSAELGGKSFLPGVHRAGTSITISKNTQVELKGHGLYLFQAGTSLTTGEGANFVFTGEGTYTVVWVLGTFATTGAGTTLPGSVLAGGAITIGVGAGVTGCAVSQTAVTFEGGGCALCPTP